jgi:uncharacterized protein (TIGR02594 family)
MREEDMAVAGSPQLGVMQGITGTHWGPSEGPNKTIGAWLQAISSQYQDMYGYCGSVIHLDYFEWCGLTVAYCMTKSGIRPVFGQKDTDKFLYALAWLEWGDTIQTPSPGDVVVFDFGGGDHHVTLFAGDAGNGYWSCLGGNQSHEVRATNYPRSCVLGIRRPSATAGAVVAGGAMPAPASAAVPGAPPAVSGSVFKGGGLPLTQAGLTQAATKLGVGTAEIWALTFTESDPPYGGFYLDKRPQILFERHIFHRLTNGRFDQGYPDISNSRPGGYGAAGAHQFDRVSLAMSLDESAALQSASWGMGQVLGQNYKAAGCASPSDLVTQAFASEDQQLLSVANEIVSDGAAKALATHDWATFARIYNGPNYAENNYDNVLRGWYEKCIAGGPDLKVRTAQMYLMYLGFNPSTIDGEWGKRTKSAMNQYQSKKGLPVTDTLDDTTYAAIVSDGNAVKGGELEAAEPQGVA